MLIRRYRGKGKGVLKGSLSSTGKYQLGREQKEKRNLKRREKRRNRKIERQKHQINALVKKNNDLNRMLEAQSVSPALGGTYKPINIAKAQLDQEEYTLSYRAVEQMRLCDSNISRYARTAIPARSTVQRVRKALAVAGERFTTPSISKEGDIVTLNENMLLEEILSITEWPGCNYDRTSHSVNKTIYDTLPEFKIDGTADGAALTQNTGMVLHGIKILDKHQSNKLTKQSSHVSVESGDSKWQGIQSSKNVIITGFCHGSDADVVNGKKNFERLSKRFFEQLEGWASAPFLHSNGLAYKIAVAFPMDKKAVRDCTMLGSGSSSPGQFCTYCSVQGAHKHLPSLLRCEKCMKHDPTLSSACFHQDIIDSKQIASALSLKSDDPLLQIILNFPSSTARVQECRTFVKDKLGMKTNVNGKTIDMCNAKELHNCIQDWMVIYTVTANNIDDIDIKVIETQLSIRLPTPQLRRTFVQNYLPADKQYLQNTADPEQHSQDLRYLLRHVLHTAARLQAARRIVGESPIISSPERCIICILHAEMRILEKLVTLMVMDAITKHPELQTSDKELVRKRLEERMCTILSSSSSSSSEESSSDTETTNSGYHSSPVKLPSLSDKYPRFQLSCTRLQKIFQNYPSLVAALFDPLLPTVEISAEVEKKRQQWESLLSGVVAIFSSLRTFEDMEADAITELQLQMDAWCRIYITMFGPHHITNYIHDMQAGHITEFLRMHGSVYRHANIGLEATMGTIKSFYFRGTQHGGHNGKGKSNFSVVDAMSQYMTGKAVAALGKLSEDSASYLENMVQEGKDIMKGSVQQA